MNNYDDQSYEMHNRRPTNFPTTRYGNIEDNHRQNYSSLNQSDGRPGYSSQYSNYSRLVDNFATPLERDYGDLSSRWQIYSGTLGRSNLYHRTTSIHRNVHYRDVVDGGSALTVPRFVELEDRRRWMSTAGNKKRKTSVELEQHADNIVNHMEQDGILMENSHESEQLRREALRDMPQCLTVKRIIKKKLNKSVSQHSKRKPISLYKSLKYRFSINISKAQNSFKSLAYTFELWYSSLKTIEGHFGSGVATYFKFFRWIFLMNCFTMIFVFAFIVIPQLLYVHIEPVTSNNNPSIIYDDNSTNAIIPEAVKWRQRPTIENRASFQFENIFTGEGFFTNTTLYYGFYTNQNINLIPNQVYQMPIAYFFTMFCMYAITFIFISTSMARSYRRSFIETQDGLKNIYAHKIFCGWDYSIATEEAADLKSSSIYNELKEILSDSKRDIEVLTFWQKFWTLVMQITVNVFMVVKLIGIGYILWYLLERNIGIEEEKNDSSADVGVIIAVSITLVVMLFPPLVRLIIRYEDYKHPRASLYVTLIRTFLLKTVIIGVFLGFWLTHSENEVCWETSIGQHVFRLTMFNFLFSIVIGTLIQVIRYFIYKKLWRKVGQPKFNIAEHTLHLLYNQTLFWVGLYFSPLLSLVVVIKLWCMWYIRRTFLLHCCKPSTKSWRAAQMHTWFLILTFISLLLVIIAHGYIIVEVKTSKCGPFRDYRYMYEMIIKGIFQLEQNNQFWRVLLYLTKPGTVALILIAMCVVVYYLRAKASAQRSMVNILREMLILEAKDKEFLLENISKVTEGQWQYNLKNQRPTPSKVPLTSSDGRNRKPREEFGDVNISGSSTDDFSSYH